MSTKKRQYIIRQLNFKKVIEEDEKLIVKESDFNEFSTSENFLLDDLYKITGKEYKEPEIIEGKFRNANRTDEIFILKAQNISEKKEEEHSRYQKIMEEGIYVDDIHYVRAEKSSNMTRNTKTLFVKADLKDELVEYISLGKTPGITYISKYISAKGLMLSSIYMMPYVPKIVVVPDFEREILDESNLSFIVPYEPKEEDKAEYEAYVKEEAEQKKSYEKYKQKKEELKDILIQDYLKDLQLTSYYNSYKTTGRWYRENYRRVKIDELEKPRKALFYHDKYYPLYSEDQTEEIKVFPLKPYSIGFEKVDKAEYEKRIGKPYIPKINAFDGMGLMSFEFVDKVSEFLGVKNTNAIIGRLPYVKGLFVKFDIKSYFKKVLKVNTIKDIFNDTHDIDDIDIIIAESCFKAKLDVDIKEGKEVKHWLFKDMKEYYDLLDKYGYSCFGIANYAKGFNRLKKYNPTTYQLLSTLDLTKNNIKQLGREQLEVIRDVLLRADTAKVKQFLDMIAGDDTQEEENDEEEDGATKEEKEEIKIMADWVKDAIEVNERMIFDKHIQMWIYQQCKRYMEGMLLGRILIPSIILYATGDIIGFCEWAAYRDPNKVKGFLNKNEFYCKSFEGKEKVLVRYPLTHWSEIKIAPFIKIDNKYLRHLYNIVQCNSYDLTMMRMNMDFDGDFLTCIDADMPISVKCNDILEDIKSYEVKKALKDAVIRDNVIFNPDDKTLSTAKAWNKENIVEFEMKNISNLTGPVTNICTTLLDIASEEGNLEGRDLEVSVCKYLQGEIIDSAKKGTTVKIPSVLKQNTRYNPYYFKHLYGGEEKKYRYPNSELSKFVKFAEKKIINLLPKDKEDKIGTDAYLDIRDVHELMVDESKYDGAAYIEIMNNIIPIFNEFSTAKGDLDSKRRAINQFDNSEDTKELRKQIQAEYKNLYEVTRNKCIEVCNNKSVLASVCTKIAYIYSKSSNSNEVNRTKTYLFPWVMAPEGVLENIKVNTTDKLSVVPKELFLNIKDTEIIRKLIGNVNIVNGCIEHRDFDKPMKLYNKDILDGTYLVWQQEGRIYTSIEVEKNIEVDKTSPVLVRNEKLAKKKIENYSCRLIFLGEKTGQEVKDLIDGKEVKLGLKDEKYISIFTSEDFVGSIAKEFWEDLKNGIMLKDYIGEDFVVVKVDQVSNKSLKITLNEVIDKAI